jgi:hypothetical protein
VGPVVRYTERFVQDKVRDIPLNVPEMRKYLSNQLFRENYLLVDRANMTGHYIEKSEYVHILIEMFSITWTGQASSQTIQPSVYAIRPDENRQQWCGRCSKAFRKVNADSTPELPAIALSLPMTAVCARALLSMCSCVDNQVQSMINVADLSNFPYIPSSAWVRNFRHPGFSSLFVEESTLSHPFYVQVCLAYDFILICKLRLVEGVNVIQFKSYIRQLPVIIDAARGHICDNTWTGFIASTRFLGSRFSSRDAGEWVPRATSFTLLHRQWALFLLQTFMTSRPAPASSSVAEVPYTNNGEEGLLSRWARLPDVIHVQHPTIRAATHLFEYLLDNKTRLPVDLWRDLDSMLDVQHTSALRSGLSASEVAISQCRQPDLREALVYCLDRSSCFDDGESDLSSDNGESDSWSDEGEIDQSLSTVHSTATVAMKADSGTAVNEICVSKGQRRVGAKRRRRQKNRQLVAPDTSVDLITVTSVSSVGMETAGKTIHRKEKRNLRKRRRKADNKTDIPHNQSS